MDLGENLVENNNIDGDGGAGYGFNGTLSYLARWTTPYTTTSAVNACPAPNLTYQAQSAGSAAIDQGFLCEITDSIFFRNLLAAAYSNANGSNALGVTVGGGSAPGKGNLVAAFNAGSPDDNMPIRSLTRGAGVAVPGVGSGTIQNVVGLDPRAFNAATGSNSAAPADGFYTVANYRGGVGPTVNWLCGWTAASAFDFVTSGCTTGTPCPADIVQNNVVNVDDLLAVINAWGPCANPNNCPADIAPAGGNDIVNVDDLLAVINGWGNCP